jgi:putative methyltransferase (TIGR04325 family)
MSVFTSLHRAVDGLRSLPGIYQMRRALFRRQFLNDPYARLFDGVYETFDEALRHAPASKPTSFDNSASAERYRGKLSVDAYDYPAMFWLAQSFEDGLTRVTDFGGSVGIKFYAFRTYMRFPASLRWLVIDMPAVAKLGRQMASDCGAPPSLEFSASRSDADGTDVLFCSGSLQYLPESLAQILDGMRDRPARIIVNTTPIHETRSFFTLNSMGTAICPYRVSARADFVDSLVDRGYRLRDDWRNIDKRMTLPFHEGFDVDHYSGFCFDARL